MSNAMSYSLIALLLLITTAIVVFAWPRYRLHQAIQQPFPAEWRRILHHNLPVYRRMPTDLQFQLQRNIKRFLHEKHFAGCGGQVITDEVRVTIAASACLLLLNRKTDVYGGLRYILVYPDAFLVNQEKTDDVGLPVIRPTGMLGQSWSNGKVILSWADVLRGNRIFDDGNNVTLHEFAHQLDHESGVTNGAPLLNSAGRYNRWARVLTSEFESLQRAAFQGDATLLNHYGATEPAEFFAVVTEVFFEKPRELALEHPALFAELKGYYRVDPTDWL